MHIKPLSSLCTGLAFLISACSVTVSQAAPATPLPQNTESASPSSGTGLPSHKQIGNPALPHTQIPVSWAGLGLTGTLVFMSSMQTPSSLSMSIQALDLMTGDITTIFQAPDTAWIDFASVSPDGNELVMAYLPPRGGNTSGGPGQQALYILPLDGSQPPQLLFAPPSTGDEYYQPTWSPDGKYIYYSHVDFNAPTRVQGQHFGYYEIYRMAYPGGQPEKIADQAYWPRLSSDGARLAYVTLSPVDGTNKLFVANPDGTGAYEIILSGQYVPPIIDAPIFTAGDRSILYSAVTPTQPSQPNWVERLFGITVASAHTVPSDWWSVPIAGGAPVQLTHVAAVGLFGSLSPDQKSIVSYSGSGIFVMSPDGTGLNMLINDNGGLAGTVNWIP